VREITNSAAYNNVFFTLAESHKRQPDLSVAIREWYAGSRAYCLGLARYTAVLANEVASCELSETDRLEDAFVVPLHLTAEEFSMGLHGGAGAHYRVFSELAEPVGISLNELRNGARRLDRPGTRELVTTINRMMNELYAGAACLRVFEIVGLKICEAFGNLCRRGTTAGWFNYSPRSLRYVDLHLDVEPRHDEMASRFIDSLCGGSVEKHNAVRSHVICFCDTLSKFWSDLAIDVFHEDACVSVHLAE